MFACKHTNKTRRKNFRAAKCVAPSPSPKCDVPCCHRPSCKNNPRINSEHDTAPFQLPIPLNDAEHGTFHHTVSTCPDGPINFLDPTHSLAPSNSPLLTRLRSQTTFPPPHKPRLVRHSLPTTRHHSHEVSAHAQRRTSPLFAQARCQAAPMTSH